MRRCSIASAAAVALLSGCADLDPAYNPIEWGRGLGRGVSELVTGEPAPPRRDAEPPPAEGRPFPNLASVPPPPSLASEASRQQDIERLAASRAEALRADQAVRAADLTPSAAAPARRAPADGARVSVGGSEPAREAAAAPAPRPPARPTPALSSSLFMGSVVPAQAGGPLAAFHRKVVEDAAAMAIKDRARLRLVGGAGPAERDAVVADLVRLGVPAARITAAARGDAPARPAIDIFVDY